MTGLCPVYYLIKVSDAFAQDRFGQRSENPIVDGSTGVTLSGAIEVSDPSLLGTGYHVRRMQSVFKDNSHAVTHESDYSTSRCR